MQILSERGLKLLTEAKTSIRSIAASIGGTGTWGMQPNPLQPTSDGAWKNVRVPDMVRFGKSGRELMPQQIEAYQWSDEREHFALYMEMRLGKTLTCIRWTFDKPYIRRILVIAPVTVLSAWAKELEEEGETYENVNLVTGSANRLSCARSVFSHPGPGKRNWVLLNYEALLHVPQITGMPWDTVILDESTKIKNPKAQTTKLCTIGFRLAKHRIILSGLPAPESPMDFYPQFQFLTGSFMGCKNFWKFRSDYFEQDYWGNWLPKRTAFNDIYYTVHQRAYVKRRADCKIGSKKLYETREVQLPPEIARRYRKLEKEFATEENMTQWIIVVQTWLARLAGGFSEKGELLHTKKADEVLSLLEAELSGEQVVVWFRFNDELRLVRDLCRNAGIQTVSILGETQVKERINSIRDFSDRKVKVLLAQLKCGKYGIDCSSADSEIYYSNGYSLEDRTQSEDRIVNPKKETPLLITDIVAKHTIDEDVIAALTDKSVTAQTFMTKMRANFIGRVGH